MPLSSSTQVRQLSDGNTAGTVLGQSPADLIAFYGATPQPQASGGAFAAVAKGEAAGLVGTFFFVATPHAVAANSTWETGLTTVIGGTASVIPQAGDLIYVNKPTAQAGVGVGNVRVSGTNSIAVSFSNLSSGAVSPTAGEVYRAVVLRGMVSNVVTLSPAPVLPNTTAEQVFTVPGIQAGSVVQVMKPSSQGGLDVAGVRVAAANQVGITFMNVGASSVTPTASEGYTVWQVAGLDATNNNILVEELITGNQSVVTVKELTYTVAGLATTDAIVGITKPSAETTVLMGGARIAGATSLAVTYGNTSTTAITPSATAEIYGITLFRPNPAAPCVTYAPALTPTGVAASTTAEQSFTVTGLTVNSPVWVNPPSTMPAGLGLVGARTSAANTLYLTFANTGATTATPPSGVYSVANFQVGNIDTGAGWIQTISPQEAQSANLLTAIRTALVANGLVAGS